MRARTKIEREEMRNRMFNHPSSERQRAEARATHDTPMDRLLRQQHKERGELGARHRREVLHQRRITNRRAATRSPLAASRRHRLPAVRKERSLPGA